MSSGTVTLTTKSVDYNGGAAYTRGHIVLTNVIGWNVDSTGKISFTSISSSDNVGGSWGLCYVNLPYYLILKPQVSYNNGSTWVDLTTKTKNIDTICVNYSPHDPYTNAVASSVTLINSLGSYQLSGDCLLRFLYATNSAPAPSSTNPYAFPDTGYSAATQVPVHVDVSWTATIKYNANGGTGAPADTTLNDSNDPKTLTVSSTVPTYTNHRFEGWKLGSTTYHGGDTISISKSDPTKTLVAQWTEFYRPGERRVSGAWSSHNRSGGACERKVSGTWTEMRTIDGGTGTGDEPTRKQSGTWYNQRKLGAE